MAFQGCLIVLGIVAENGPTGAELAAVAYQAIPEIVAGLVTKMAQQRAIRLAHGLAQRGALGVVGFPQRHA